MILMFFKLLGISIVMGASFFGFIYLIAAGIACLLGAISRHEDGQE